MLLKQRIQNLKAHYHQLKESVGWFKAAARLDFDWSAVGELLERMGEFFAVSAGWPVAVQRILAFEAEKVYSPGKRYARRKACHV